ncbi:hypothetical protein ABPG74_005132 [Tetrahymena malaccensis]
MSTQQELLQQNPKNSQICTNYFLRNKKKNDIKYNEDEQQQFALQKLRLIRKKKVIQIKTLRTKFIEKEAVQSDQISLCRGICIQKDGILRFYYSIKHFSFGFNFYQNTQIKYLKKEQLIEVNLSILQQKQLTPIDEAIKYVSKINQPQKNECKKVLIQLKNYNQYVQSVLGNIQITKQFIQEKDEEMEKFVEFCMNYISEYSKISENKIFQFTIGRFNYELKDIQIVKTGFSQSFLNLIGIDFQNLCNLLLRQKEVDLMLNKEDIMKYSIEGLYLRILKQLEMEYQCYIQTFDGFPIQVSIKKKQILPCNEVIKSQACLFQEYIFEISELDVDLKDLANLINYREKIIKQNKDLPFDSFINKELSLILEDVEYSIQSELFMQKYYQDNLKQLSQLKDQYKNIKFNIDQSKMCKFRQIYSDSDTRKPEKLTSN